MELAMTRRIYRRRRSSGFTLVESLIAAAIFLIVCVGVIPLFIRAMANNSTGGELTQKINQSDSRVEQFYPLNINDSSLNWAGGSTELVTMNYYTRGVDPDAALGLATDRGWVAEGATAPGTRGPIQWQRTTRIRNYNIQDFSNAALNSFGELPSSFPPTPLAGGANVDEVSFKEIVVDLRNFESGGAAQRIDGTNGFNSTRFATYKAF